MRTKWVRFPEELQNLFIKMAKARKGSKENPMSETPDIIFTGAGIKDGYLNYSYRINKGPKEGFEVNEKGKGIIKSECQDAFNKFIVHLACIDELFKHQGIDVEDIDQFHNDENVLNYEVNSFKVSGDEGNETVILKGSKQTSLGVINIETPKIGIDGLSSYHWHNELKAAVDEARHQTEKYNNGFFDMPEKNTISVSVKQMTITDQTDGMPDDEFKEAAI